MIGRGSITQAIGASLAVAACAPCIGAALVSQSRSVESFALASDGMGTVQDPEMFTSATPGSFDRTAESGAIVGAAVGAGRGAQASIVSASRITMTSSVQASVSATSPLFARADGDSRLRVTFDVAQDEMWSLDAEAAITGAPFGSGVYLVLTVDSAILLEFNTALGWTSAHQTLTLDPGLYVLDIQLSSTLDSQGAAGADDTGASLSFSFARTPACPGDANGNFVVDFVDLNHVLSDFGSAGLALLGDVDHDGDCDFLDLNVVLSNFGDAC